PAGLPEASRWHLIGPEHELNVPEEMFAAIIEHPIFEPFEGITFGKHPLIICQPHRTEAHAKTQLRIPKSRADYRISSKAAALRRFSDFTQTIGRQRKPSSGERLHFRRDVKIFTQYRFQAFRIARLASQPTREEQLRRIRHCIALL